MPKVSKFEKFLALEAHKWPNGPLVTSRLNVTREQALDIFKDYHADYGVDEDEDYVSPILDDLKEDWVHYHGGYDEWGEWGNGWYLGASSKQRGAKPVWTLGE